MVFAIHWHESATDLHVFPILNPPLTSLPIPHPSGSSQCTSPEHLSHASNLDWRCFNLILHACTHCFRKGRGTRDQIANIHWITEKAREIQKNIYYCFINYAKAFGCVDHNKLWKILKEMGIADHLTCLLRSPMQDKKQQIEPDMKQKMSWKLRKEYHQGCILSLCLFNFNAEYITWNAGLDEAQAGIKIPWRNINNLRYLNDISLMAESKEELKSLLM